MKRLGATHTILPSFKSPTLLLLLATALLRMMPWYMVSADGSISFAVTEPGRLFSLANSAPEEPDSGSEDGKRLVTFVDLLSSDERFSEYLHIVQRLRMVISLNRIRNATMFVPTNDAIKRYRKEHEHNLGVAGNTYGGVTDQQAWYHLIADGIIDKQTLSVGTMLWESYSHPVESRTVSTADNQLQGIMVKTQIDSNTTQPVVNGMPVLAQDFSCEAGNAFLIDGVLEIPPRILDILHKGALSKSQQQRLSAGEDGGAFRADEYGFVEKLIAAAGWLDAIDASKGAASESAEMHTLWAFDDRAFVAGFNFAERAYLLHGPTFAADDQDMLDDAIRDTQTVAARYISTGIVSVARLGEGEHKVAGFKNHTAHVLVVEKSPADDGSTSSTLDGQRIGNADIIAENGIVHGIEQVHRPDELSFTPQKMLVGLNATMFIRLLKDTGLHEYIDGSRPTNKLTILAPTNRAMEDAFGYDLGDDDSDDGDENNNGDRFAGGTLFVSAISKLFTHFEGLDRAEFIESLREYQPAMSPRERQRDWARYHIIDGQYLVDDLVASPLLRTIFSPKSTGGAAQVVKAHVDQAHGALSKHISFNSADNILPEPVTVGNTTIYLLSSAMSTPPSLVNALITNLDLSLFVAAMGASNIVDQVQQEAGVTVLAPVIDSFTSLGLVWSYLSLPGDAAAKNDLSRLVKAHILKKPVYSDEIPLHSDSSAETLVVETLNGNKVGLYRTQNGLFAAVDPDELPKSVDSKPSQPSSASMQSLLSLDSSSLRISESDILLRTGVAHVLGDGIILPSNVEITSSKLLQGMKAYVFVDLLERCNLTYVLDDPRSSRINGLSNDGGEDDPVDSIVGYSLLVPSDKAWRENSAYRELVRRDHEEARIFDEDDDSDNAWRNSTTSDIMRYLGMLVRLHIIPIINDDPQALEAGGHQLPAKQLRLSDRKTYPTLLDNINLKANEFASNRFSVQLDDMPFYQSPGGAPFISYAMVVRSGIARTGAVFELDTALRLPPDNNKGPGGWKQFAWNAAVWLTGIGMGSGFLGVSGYWVRQWWTRSDYESL